MDSKENTTLMQTQQQYLGILTDRINQQLSEIADIHKKNTLLHQKNGDLEQQAVEQKQLIEQLQSERKGFFAEDKAKNKAIANLKEKNMLLSNENRKLQLGILDVAKRESLLKEKIDEMENSKSWKITRPLRWLIWRIRKGGRN